MSFSAGDIIAGLLFSSIGFVVFRYGKAQGHFRLTMLGVVLMAYSYFMPNVLANWLVGASLTAALYFFNDWLKES